ESAQSAKNAHSQDLESAAARAPARRTLNGSEIRQDCKSQREDSPAATARQRTAAAQCEDRAIPPASSVQSEACRVHVARSLRLASSFQNSSASPSPWLRPTLPQPARHRNGRSPLSALGN